jgi:glycosyl transferase family 87
VKSPAGPPDIKAKLPLFFSVVVPLVFAVVIVIRGIPVVIKAYDGSEGYPLDLQYLIDGGRLITSDHPELLYVPPGDVSKFGFAYGYPFPGAYAYAPTFAYATAPLAHVGLTTGFDIWKAGVFICVLIVALATASVFRSWWWRLAVVAAALTWEPLLTDARFGQSGALGAALLVGGVLLFLSNRLWGAAVLGLTIFKPTVAIGPAIMVLAEKPRVVAAFCIVAAIIAFTPFLWLGSGPLIGWLQTLVTRPIQEYLASSRLNQGITSNIHLNGTTARLFLSIALLVLVAACHFVELKAGVEAAGALAVCGSLIANPHALAYDWGIAFAVILLLRRAERLPFWSTDAGAGIVLILLFIAGDISWKLADHNATVRPLLYWALAVMAGILVTVFVPHQVGAWAPSVQPVEIKKSEPV